VIPFAGHSPANVALGAHNTRLSCEGRGSRPARPSSAPSGCCAASPSSAWCSLTPYRTPVLRPTIAELTHEGDFVTLVGDRRACAQENDRYGRWRFLTSACPGYSEDEKRHKSEAESPP
jgi:hypothetical protein